MQHILGEILINNDAEIFKDHASGKDSYSLLGLQAAISEGNRRMRHNPAVIKINIHEVFDGVRRISQHQGQYGLVYSLIPEGVPME